MHLQSSILLLTPLLSVAGVSGFVTPRHVNVQSPTFCRRVEANLTPFSLHDFDLTLSQNAIETSKTLLQSYQASLTENPITTKLITSAILTSVGDAIAQYGSKGDEPFQYDAKRGICFLGFGALYTGVFQHFWFQFLSSHIREWGEFFNVWGPSRASLPVEFLYPLKQWWMYFDIVSGMENPPTDIALATGKLAINQFLVIPALYMPLFFALTGALANLNIEKSIERAITMYPSLLIRNYFYWLPMQFLQFLVIPAPWQIPFISAASLVWTVILSSVATSQPQTIVYEGASPDGLVLAQANDITDDVTLEDIEKALIPQVARDALADPKVGATTAGGAVGLLAAAADEGLIGEVVAGMLGAEAGAGVMAMTAIGAGIGLLTASQSENEETIDETLEKSEDKTMNMTTNMTTDSLLLAKPAISS